MARLPPTPPGAHPERSRGPSSSWPFSAGPSSSQQPRRLQVRRRASASVCPQRDLAAMARVVGPQRSRGKKPWPLPLAWASVPQPLPLKQAGALVSTPPPGTDSPRLPALPSDARGADLGFPPRPPPGPLPQLHPAQPASLSPDGPCESVAAQRPSQRGPTWRPPEGAHVRDGGGFLSSRPLQEHRAGPAKQPPELPGGGRGRNTNFTKRPSPYPPPPPRPSSEPARGLGRAYAGQARSILDAAGEAGQGFVRRRQVGAARERLCKSPGDS